MKKKYRYLFIGLLSANTLIGHTAMAQDQSDIAKKLSNPVAALISVPIQANYDDNIGTDDGSVWKTNIQPVIPFSIGQDWNLISRTILPVIDQVDIPKNGSGESGVGDVVQSFFFSPKQPSSNGLIWGVGPALLLDTASDAALGSGKWGAGPTGVALKQEGPWTYGVLANHIESFAGDSSRTDVSSTYLQPFMSYITETKTTLGVNTESTYDWKAEQWSVPFNFTLNQLIKAGDQLLQVGGGARYWAESPDNGPDGWGLRLQITFLYPK
ncbi:MAG: hypothetical protein WCD50_05180 [Onishia taeanensis]|uniref:hypothetical protein n=1 Tax=Onishia taeanensis TaxID=284577 RepID=UPI003C7DDCD3